MKKTYTFDKNEAEQFGFTETYEVEEGTLWVDSEQVALDEEEQAYESRGFIDYMNDKDFEETRAAMEHECDRLEAMGFSYREIEYLFYKSWDDENLEHYKEFRKQGFDVEAAGQQVERHLFRFAGHWFYEPNYEHEVETY
jgi:hypothetical protein